MNNLSRIELKKSNKKWKKVISIIFLIIFIPTISYGGLFFYKAKYAFNQSQVDLHRDGSKSELREEVVTFGKNPISILLLGIEKYSTNGQDGRADTQMLLTLNPHTNQITMTTIPRDTRVYIENAGEYTGVHKINAAYTYGSINGYGAVKLQLETVEKLLNVPIDKFIAIDFDGFRDIVDALGGVKVNIKTGFWEQNIYKQNKRIYFEKGETTLNGEEALAFVRMRKRTVNNTYSREERQQEFLKAIVNQAVSTGTIFKLGQITDILGDNIRTDLSAKEIYSLQKKYSNITNSSMKTLELGGENQYVNGGSYFIPEKKKLEELSNKLNENLGLDNVSNFNTNADIPVIQ